MRWFRWWRAPFMQMSEEQQRSAARAVPSPAAGDSITQTSRGGDFEPAASAAKVSEPPSPPPPIVSRLQHQRWRRRLVAVFPHLEMYEGKGTLLIVL